MINRYIALDIGTGFVKAYTDSKSTKFPSVYAYRGSTKWEKRKSRIDGVGEEAKRIIRYPDAVIQRPVLEGKPVDPEAFKAVVREAIKRLDIDFNDLPNCTIAVGLPYSASQDRNKLRNLIMQSLKPKECYVLPQAYGTLVAEGKEDAIIVAIGQGTTEIVVFDEKKAITGKSLPQACDYLFEGTDDKLAHLELDNQRIASHRITGLAEIISGEVNQVLSTLSRRYDIIVCGGGVLVSKGKLYTELKDKLSQLNVTKAREPIYSNAMGMFSAVTSMK